jgi:hypothetical protein
MLIANYDLPDRLATSMAVDTCLASLQARAAASANELLLVWKRAFWSKDLECHFRQPSWPIELLDAMPPGPTWAWKLAKGKERVPANDELLAAVRAGAGVDGVPEGNVHVTLELRGYDERQSDIGGLDWWRSRVPSIRERNGFGCAFANAILHVLKQAHAQRSELFIEQMSIVLSKDPGAPISTLTPTLHSDLYYGARETAITSLLEKGWEGFGGAMFTPACRMDRIWHLRPITIDNLLDKVGGEDIVQTDSGDILIYGGMLGKDGASNPANGIPHISPDCPGRSARLGILMHQRSAAQ